MAEGRRIVITGISSLWGAELARRLELDPGVEAIYGIDTEPPPIQLSRTELIECDIRSPLLARVLPTTEPDTVVHCGIVWNPMPGKPARALHDINVIGSLQLLAACEGIDSLRNVVVRGSAAIYGCEGPAPMFYREDMARQFPLRTRFQRDIGELESYFDNFARRHPQLTCCMLRFQPEIGPDSDSPMSTYLSLPVVPVQLGFDPRLQFLHSEDCHGALEAAVRDPIRGAVNVGPSGSISLSRMLRLAGRPTAPVPHFLFEAVVGQISDSIGVSYQQSDAVRMLRFGRGVDNTRLRKEVGYTPRYDAAGAVHDYVRRGKGRRVAPVPNVGSVLGALARIGAPEAQPAARPVEETRR